MKLALFLILACLTAYSIGALVNSIDVHPVKIHAQPNETVNYIYQWPPRAADGAEVPRILDISIHERSNKKSNQTVIQGGVGQKFIIIQFDSEIGDDLDLIITTTYVRSYPHNTNCGSHSFPWPCPNASHEERVIVPAIKGQSVNYTLTYIEKSRRCIGTIDYVNHAILQPKITVVTGSQVETIIIIQIESKPGINIDIEFTFWGYWG